jgi:chemotaxis protein CheD
MGQIAVGREPEHFKSVLGSCIGLVLYHPRLKMAAMAHIVLPDSAERNGTPGKFADTAIPHMLQLLKEQGSPLHGLTAKFTGGANMFGGTGPMKIGDANAEAVSRALKIAGVRVAGQDVGGAKGRRVVFDCSTCEMTIAVAGQPERTL